MPNLIKISRDEDNTSGSNLDPAITDAIDKRVLDSLRVLQQEGEPDLVGELITVYLSEAAKSIDDLGKFLQAEDAQGIYNMAHKLKSSSANLGATNFASLLKQAESMGRQNQIEDAARLFPEICREYEAVRKRLEAELAGCNAG
jgi:HPt (histidine-containing phosphotransfer) domain-containing protein